MTITPCNAKPNATLGDCSICLTKLHVNTTVSDPCGHLFHFQCLNKYYTNLTDRKVPLICPLNRKKVASVVYLPTKASMCALKNKTVTCPTCHKGFTNPMSGAFCINAHQRVCHYKCSPWGSTTIDPFTKGVITHLTNTYPTTEKKETPTLSSLDQLKKRIDTLRKKFCNISDDMEVPPIVVKLATVMSFYVMLLTVQEP